MSKGKSPLLIGATKGASVSAMARHIPERSRDAAEPEIVVYYCDLISTKYLANSFDTKRPSDPQ